MLVSKKEKIKFHITYFENKEDYFCKGVNIYSDTFSNAAFKFEREVKHYKIINIFSQI